MTSIIIETRQLNNNTKSMANGDYITTLNENILLEENDQILIRNAFVDTVPISNQYIELNEDYTLTINFLYYQYNFSDAGQTGFDNYAEIGWQILGNPPVPTPTTIGQSVAGTITGQISNLTKKYAVSNTEFAIYTEIQFFRTDSGAGNWGGISFEFHYYNFSGDEEIYHGNIPVLPNGDYETKIKIGKILANKNTTPPFLVITPDNLRIGRIIEGYNNPNFFTKSDLPSGMQTYEPIIGTKSGTISKGKYAPSEIASRISKIFQETTLNNPFDLTSSNSLLIKTGTGTPEHQFIMNVNSQVYKDTIKAEGNLFNITNPQTPGGDDYLNSYIGIYNYNNPLNKQEYWVGSSQFDMQYDDESNKFFIEYMHTPYYGTATEAVQTNEIITVNQNNFNPNKGGDGIPNNCAEKKTFYTKALGGIALTSMTSSPTGFWDNICGFDLNDITVQADYETLDPLITGNANEYLVVNELTLIPYINYEEGKNITAPFIINDMSISKNSNFPEVIAPAVGDQIQIAGINSIYARNVILNNINENAYYLIEIESKFKNNLLTSDFGNMKNVAGIANTYFNSSNFTSTNSADSFIYQHSGEPQMLQSFGIRILDSTKNLATGLGPDNTVFIEIIKAPKIPPQIEDSNEQKQIKGALREQHMAKEEG